LKEIESSENETSILESQLKEVNEHIGKKEEVVITLKKRVNAVIEENANTISKQQQLNTNTELKKRIIELSKEQKEILGVLELLKEKRKNMKVPEIVKIQREIMNVYDDVISLSAIVAEISKGNEPGIQSLWNTQHSKETKRLKLSSKEIDKLESAVELMRTSILDYYAEKCSNECHVQ
jgi:hypothetical protein